MERKIVTIGRECGSGGHSIGQKLAGKLGVPFYDNEIIGLVAKEKRYTEEYIEKNEEYMMGGVLFSHACNLPYANVILPGKDQPLHDQIYFTQIKVIRELADKGPCVIVGRCADHILKDYKSCLNVFIHADMDSKIRRSMMRDHISREEAEKRIMKRDKARAYHYNYYTDKTWGDSRNYHLSLDSGMLGEESCVSIIAGVFLDKEKECSEKE